MQEAYNHVAAFINLFHRLLNVPLDKEKFTKECDTILQLALIIGFPPKLIDRIFHKVYNKYAVKGLIKLSPINNQEYTFFSVPFIPIFGTSKNFQKTQYQTNLYHL